MHQIDCGDPLYRQAGISTVQAGRDIHCAGRQGYPLCRQAGMQLVYRPRYIPTAVHRRREVAQYSVGDILVA